MRMTSHIASLPSGGQEQRAGKSHITEPGFYSSKKMRIYISFTLSIETKDAHMDRNIYQQNIMAKPFTKTANKMKRFG